MSACKECFPEYQDVGTIGDLIVAASPDKVAVLFSDGHRSHVIFSLDRDVVVAEPFKTVPDDELTDAHLEAFTAWNEMIDTRVAPELRMDPLLGVEVVAACEAEGFRRDEHGRLDMWIVNKLADMLKTE